MDRVNESFEKEEMSNSQGQAVITLIERKGKDHTLFENWRPISPVNVLILYSKIISKVIANRIKKILPNIIHLTTKRAMLKIDLSEKQFDQS